MKDSQSLEVWKKAQSEKDKPPPVAKRPAFHSSHHNPFSSHKGKKGKRK
jgi:hypothetical protein